jgi:hypothetical protein
MTAKALKIEKTEIRAKVLKFQEDERVNTIKAILFGAVKHFGVAIVVKAINQVLRELDKTHAH